MYDYVVDGLYVELEENRPFMMSDTATTTNNDIRISTKKEMPYL